ncbi:MAG: hypothetical protein AAFU85_13550 [Planctomycetota bacterium]
MLCSLEIEPAEGPMPERLAYWVAAAYGEGKSVDCFDYIPSCPRVLYGYLQVIPARSYCEWGSGMGIGVGLATALRMNATGVEANAELASKSQALLNRFELSATIHHGDYHESDAIAEAVYVYCWPGQVNQVKERFERIAPHASWLLLADGAESIQVFFQKGSPPIDQAECKP